MNHKKSFTAVFIAVIFLMTAVPSLAAENSCYTEQTESLIQLEDGTYYETVLSIKDSGSIGSSAAHSEKDPQTERIPADRLTRHGISSAADKTNPANQRPANLSDSTSGKASLQRTGNTSRYIKGSRAMYHKSKSGKILWYVKVSGTFRYDGSSAKCIKSSAKASAKSSGWKIIGKSSSSRGNTASAKATARYSAKSKASKHRRSTVKSLTVTLNCSPSGTFY